MRKHARWMAQPDDRILEFLAENGTCRIEGLRRGLATEGGGLEYPRQYLEKRCERLRAHGLLDHEGRRDRYAITRTGRAYLRGALDAATLGSDDRTAEPAGSPHTIE